MNEFRSWHKFQGPAFSRLAPMELDAFWSGNGYGGEGKKASAQRQRKRQERDMNREMYERKWNGDRWQAFRLSRQVPSICRLRTQSFTVPHPTVTGGIMCIRRGRDQLRRVPAFFRMACDLGTTLLGITKAGGGARMAGRVIQARVLMYNAGQPLQDVWPTSSTSQPPPARAVSFAAPT